MKSTEVYDTYEDAETALRPGQSARVYRLTPPTVGEQSRYVIADNSNHAYAILARRLGYRAALADKVRAVTKPLMDCTTIGEVLAYPTKTKEGKALQAIIQQFLSADPPTMDRVVRKKISKVPTNSVSKSPITTRHFGNSRRGLLAKKGGGISEY